MQIDPPSQFQLRCTSCGSVEVCSLRDMVRRLQAIGMLRREDAAEGDLASELFISQIDRFTCANCGAATLALQQESDDDDGEWGQGRACEACGQSIPPERLEIFPDSRRCVKCQQVGESGQSDEEPEFCPRCGSIMEMRQRRGTGLAGYTMFCPSCRRT